MQLSEYYMYFCLSIWKGVQVKKNHEQIRCF